MYKRQGRNEPKDRDETTSHPEGDSHESSRRSKRKRRALRKWWRRFVEKAWVGRTKTVKRDGVADAKARLVEELRKRLEQHPEDLWVRAKAVLHELDDDMLLRYLIYSVVWKATAAVINTRCDSTLRYLVYYFVVIGNSSRELLAWHLRKRS